jgi:predicted component of type VI protein secretion system
MHAGVADMGVPEFPIVMVVIASSQGAEVKQSILKGDRFVYIVGDVVGSFIQKCELSLYFHV